MLGAIWPLCWCKLSTRTRFIEFTAGSSQSPLELLDLTVTGGINGSVEGGGESVCKSPEYSQLTDSSAAVAIQAVSQRVGGRGGA